MNAKSKKAKPDDDDEDVEAAAERDKLIAERQEVSSNISAQVRAVSFGVLAIVWLVLSGTEDTLKTRFASQSITLLWIAALCVVALLLDFAQSLAALAEINKEVRAAENTDDASDVGYDSPALRRISNAAFVLKVAAAPTAALWLMVVIFRALTA